MYDALFTDVIVNEDLEKKNTHTHIQNSLLIRPREYTTYTIYWFSMLPVLVTKTYQCSTWSTVKICWVLAG